MKILIAEDNATNRELFRELLEARGYDVEEACDGPEALRMLEQSQPDIVLLDIGMPVLDGFAVVRAIRANSRLADLSRTRRHGICHARGSGTHYRVWLRWISLETY